MVDWIPGPQEVELRAWFGLLESGTSPEKFPARVEDGMPVWFQIMDGVGSVALPSGLVVDSAITSDCASGEVHAVLVLRPAMNEDVVSTLPLGVCADDTVVIDTSFSFCVVPMISPFTSVCIVSNIVVNSSVNVAAVVSTSTVWSILSIDIGGPNGSLVIAGSSTHASLDTIHSSEVLLHTASLNSMHV